jgi:hypothetical protein
MRDWLVAMDDAITARQTHCTVCGQRLGAHGWSAIEQIGALSVATMRCLACYGQDPDGARQRGLLRRRYAAGPSSLEGK